MDRAPLGLKQDIPEAAAPGVSWEAWGPSQLHGLSLITQDSGATGRHPGRDVAFLHKTQICFMVSVCAFIIVITELKEK